MWRQVDGGLTKMTIGSENGNIIADEASDLGARITIEEGGKIAPYSITCGIYGLFCHTVFFGSHTEAINSYEEMKNEIQAFLLNNSLTDTEAIDWCESFTNKY